MQFAERHWIPSEGKTQTRLLHKSLGSLQAMNAQRRHSCPSAGRAARPLYRDRGPGREAAGGQSRQHQGQSPGTAAATPLTSTAAGSAPPRPGEASGTLGHSGPVPLEPDIPGNLYEVGHHPSHPSPEPGITLGTPPRPCSSPASTPSLSRTAGPSRCSPAASGPPQRARRSGTAAARTRTASSSPPPPPATAGTRPPPPPTRTAWPPPPPARPPPLRRGSARRARVGAGGRRRAAAATAERRKPPSAGRAAGSGEMPPGQRGGGGRRGSPKRRTSPGLCAAPRGGCGAAGGGCGRSAAAPGTHGSAAPAAPPSPRAAARPANSELRRRVPTPSGGGAWALSPARAPSPANRGTARVPRVPRPAPQGEPLAQA